MRYLLSALMGIILLASWALIVVVAVSCHHRGMERVRRAERAWQAERERHPAGSKL